jgi:hypothetical protein
MYYLVCCSITSAIALNKPVSITTHRYCKNIKKIINVGLINGWLERGRHVGYIKRTSLNEYNFC